MNDFKKTGWAEDIFRILNTHHVRQVAYVPDAGHTELINLCNDNQAKVSVPLTTERKGLPCWQALGSVAIEGCC